MRLERYEAPVVEVRFLGLIDDTFEVRSRTHPDWPIILNSVLGFWVRLELGLWCSAGIHQYWDLYNAGLF